jgi:hypothetical protein
MRKWLPAGEAIFQRIAIHIPLPHRSEVQVGIIFMDKIVKKDGSRKVYLLRVLVYLLVDFFLLISPGPSRALARSVSCRASRVEHKIPTDLPKLLEGKYLQ